MKTYTLHRKSITTVFLLLGFLLSGSNLQAQQVPPCEECMTVDLGYMLVNKTITVRYKVELDGPPGYYRTHYAVFFLNDEEKQSSGNEFVGFGGDPKLATYEYTFDSSPYAGKALKISVKEYKTKDENNKGDLFKETIKTQDILIVSILESPYFGVAYTGEPNSCRGEKITEFEGVPTANELKALTARTSEMFLVDKGATTPLALNLSFAIGFTKVTYSFAGTQPNGDGMTPETELPLSNWEVNSAANKIFPSLNYKIIVIFPLSDQLSKHKNYNYSYPIVIKLYIGSEVIRTIVVPLLVVGEDTQVSQQSPTTRSAPIPQMVLHNPIGDGSSTYMKESKTVCTEITTSLSAENGQSGYLKLDVGVEGSIVGIPIEAGASTTGSLNSSQSNSQEIVHQGCITAAKGIKITNPEDESQPYTGTEGDYFMGAATEYYYGPSYKVTHSNCVVEAQNGIGLKVKTIYPFLKREFEIEEEIQNLTSKIALLGENAVDQPKKRQMENDKKAWEDMVRLNKKHVQEASETIDTYVVRQGASPSFDQEVKRSEKFSLNTKLFVESSVEGTVGVKVAGTGFEAGAGVSVSNEVSNGNTQSEDYSSINGYELAENELGDEVTIRVKKDNYFGTYIFELLDSQSKTSCPYIGGKRRDVPALSIGEEMESYLYINDAPIGDGESDKALIQLNVCNHSESDETRSYRLQVVNSQSADVFYSGDPLTNEGVVLDALDAGVCEKYFITIDQPQSTLVSFKGIKLRLTDHCEQFEDITSVVTLDVDFVEKTTGTFSLPPELKGAKLLQNYPNPASGQTSISFHIPNAARQADLQIMGPDGRLVHSFPITTKGNGQLAIPTLELSQGIWFYRLVLNGIAVDTKKMAVFR